MRYWPGCTKDPEWMKQYIEMLAAYFAEQQRRRPEHFPQVRLPE